jgi:uncharacterized OsmC-like protein
MSEKHPRQPVVVTHEGGVKFAAQVRSHRVLVDQPLHGAGQDSAPTPIELLGVSLGTCIAFYVQQFCHTRGLPYEGMSVEIETYGAANPSRIGHFVVRVLLPSELPEPYATMLERVVRSCPAHNTLNHGADISVEIETAASVGA